MTGQDSSDESSRLPTATLPIRAATGLAAAFRLRARASAAMRAPGTGGFRSQVNDRR